MARSRQPETIEELLDKVVVCPSGCWLWAGGDDGYSGYGRINKPGTRTAMAAHRYVYEKFKGPIPPGWHVDHACVQWAWLPSAHVRCVNPDHLEAVTPLVNQQRRALRSRQTQEMPLACEPIEPEVTPPLLAPGEGLDDLAFT